MVSFEENMGLAYGYLARYKPHIDGYEKEDLQQEAFLALWKACESFDADKGVQFSTYAYMCMRNHFVNVQKKHHSVPTVPLDDVPPEQLARKLSE